MFCAQQGWLFEVVADLSSGMNYHKKGLKRLLGDILCGDVGRLSFTARVLLDSISPAGVRLTTIEATFQRFVLSEFTTHPAFSRNATPIAKVIAVVRNNPAMPSAGEKQHRDGRARRD